MNCSTLIFLIPFVTPLELVLLFGFHIHDQHLLTCLFYCLVLVLKIF
uniref:Uncharacterized protein n=1 Tax=Manihot esculenta TaxID=3983 RepID=A0A2C9UP95_MANES